jgi:prepilin-type N-terminal cleavage/methylation domain-containing protein
MYMRILKLGKGQGQKGFTLLEVLLVVAVIAILAGIVIIAINPGKNLGDSRNAQRSADVTTILNAVYQYSLDNNGNVPATITAAAVEICNTTGAGCSSPTAIDLGVLTTNGKYIVSIPKDPQCPSACLANGAGYTILKDATTGRITVSAPDAEQGKTITVTR